MVFGIIVDGAGAVQLFQHHNAGKLMREGHAGHGKTQLRLLLYFFGQAPGTADNKGNMTGTLHLCGGDLLRQLWRGEHLAFDAHCDYVTLRRNFS